VSLSKAGLFDGPAPRVVAAPASSAFLDLLAERMIAALYKPSDPFALADALVLLPNRRAGRGLMDAFAERLGGAALLPSIKPLGDLDDDPDVWGPEPIALNIPPEIPPIRQRLELAALIQAREAATGGIEDPARALAFADALNRMMQSAAAADEVAWDKLPHLADAADLAEHWRRSAVFLDIVATYWPQRLAADGLADPAQRRSAVLYALAKEWEREPPNRPIIIAGSTGSVAATRALMKAVARLPQGVVVLPGLDTDLDDETWRYIGEQHPQYALQQTLLALGLERRDVRVLEQENETGRARRVLMREALAPAEKTADWLRRIDEAGGKAFVAGGAQGLSILEAATENEEALSIALLMREAYEDKKLSAALITPDAKLARRVMAKLARWNLQPVASHGSPLRETEAGSLLAVLCDLARDAGDGIALAALIKHPLVTFVAPQARVDFEHDVLRGPKRWGDLVEMQSLTESVAAQTLIAKLIEVLAPLIDCMARETITLADFAECLAQSAEEAAGQFWRGGDGETAAGLIQDAKEHGADLGAMEPWRAPRAFTALMQGRDVPPLSGGDPRLAILGPLEARLQRRDLIILGALNEGVWPASPPDDPFLSRPMRAELGLPPLDARIGLAAHDFAQLANAPRVVLTRSVKRDGAPSVASRWLWRLETLARGAGIAIKREQDALGWARALDAPQRVTPVRRPEPRPPVEARLKRISVTQVETLIRDPYALYARRILRLEALKAVGAEAGPAERGTAIHKAIERFEGKHDPALLLSLLDEELRRAGFPPERRFADLLRLRDSVDAYCDWAREQRGAKVFLEKAGKLDLNGVMLTAKADRIEIGAEGATILDFKTGAPPSDKQVQSGLAPQLLLEAAMLARGAFAEAGVPKVRVRDLIYWRFGGADPKPRAVKFETSVEEAAEEALQNLQALLARYSEPDQAFYSKPRVQFIKPYADYDHLARRKEWADAEGES
jgi:ATP-dependent helicase/nuclease subunit B